MPARQVFLLARIRSPNRKKSRRQSARALACSCRRGGRHPAQPTTPNIYSSAPAAKKRKSPYQRQIDAGKTI